MSGVEIISGEHKGKIGAVWALREGVATVNLCVKLCEGREVVNIPAMDTVPLSHNEYFDKLADFREEEIGKPVPMPEGLAVIFGYDAIKCPERFEHIRYYYSTVKIVGKNGAVREIDTYHCGDCENRSRISQALISAYQRANKESEFLGCKAYYCGRI